MKIITTLLLLCLASCTGDVDKLESIREGAGKSVVKITGMTSYGYRSGGTGFLVKTTSGKKYILTNRHICALQSEQGTVEVKFPGLSRVFNKRVIEVSLQHDLCLVESIPMFNNYITVAPRMKIGQVVFITGHPNLYALTVAKGTYIEEDIILVASSSKGNYIIDPSSSNSSPSLTELPSSRFNMYARGGNSGSPIVNDDGELVSVLYAGSRSDVLESYGVPHRFIVEFLEGY